MRKNIFTLLIFLASLNFISCSSESSDDDVIETPDPSDRWGEWSAWTPEFTNQTADFTQSRSRSVIVNGDRDSNSPSGEANETRNISVTSNEVREETDEYIEEEDINNDGDEVDDITLINTTYTASENLGSHIIYEYEVDEDRDEDFFNTAAGFWYSELFADQGNGELEPAGYIGFDIFIDGDILTYVSDDGSCKELSEGDSEGGTVDVVVDDLDVYLAAVYDIDLTINDQTFTFDVYTGWEKDFDDDGAPIINYFITYYLSAVSYYLPAPQEFLDGTQAAIDFVLDADLYVVGTLSPLDDENVPDDCSTSKRPIDSSFILRNKDLKKTLLLKK